MTWNRTPTGEVGTCAECGGTFARKRGDRPGRRFCSSTCGNRWKARTTATHRADTLRGRGACKGYRKLRGRHEHRVIAEEKLGRSLRPGEIVHHENEDKQDNRPENLEVLPSQAEHARRHVAALIAARRRKAAGAQA